MIRYQRTETEAEIEALVGGVWEVLPPIQDAIAAVLTTTELSSLIS
eukprot:COSAG01_NODE_63932_length_278_cov_0.821229_2_plen_45_part_01